MRTVEAKDLEALQKFFVGAYGENTVFQSEAFLRYYFAKPDEPDSFMPHSLVIMNEDNEIVSHYGGLYSEIRLYDRTVPMVWGVNAYTLKEWRGNGFNSKIVTYIHENNEVNAVIGMPVSAPSFYAELGYNIFESATMDRYVCVLDDSTFDVVEKLGCDRVHAEAIIKKPTADFIIDRAHNIILIDKNNFDQLDFQLEDNEQINATTIRSKKFLKHRLIDNPFIEYLIYGFVEENTVRSYMAIRIEKLMPWGNLVYRIIDIYGNKEGIVNLLNVAGSHAKDAKALYLDFSMFGELYADILLNQGYNKLSGSDVSLLPMVTNPVQKKSNNEFIVLQSKKHNAQIRSLEKEDVYFTRIDADRDRIAKIDQIVAK